MEPSVYKQDYVCEMCGNEGYRKGLVTCSSCGARQHMYCMLEVMMEVPKEWQCDDCQNMTQDLLGEKAVEKRLVEFSEGPSECCSSKMPKVSSTKLPLVEYSDSESEPYQHTSFSGKTPNNGGRIIYVIPSETESDSDCEYDEIMMEIVPRKKSKTENASKGNSPSKASTVKAKPSSTRKQNPPADINHNSHSIVQSSLQPPTTGQPSLQLITSEGYETQFDTKPTLENDSPLEPDNTDPPSPHETDVIPETAAATTEQRTNNVKIHIGIDGKTFNPDITKEINRIITKNWRGAYLNWNQVPETIKEMWWAQFAGSFQWEPTLEQDVNKLFKSKASAKIRNFVTRSKKSMNKPSHVTIEDWELMKTKFEDITYINKCNKAQEQRKRYMQGGGSSYCGGSLNANEHRKRLERELNRRPTILEIFNRTHKRNDGSWSGERAKKVVEIFSDLQKSQEGLDDNEKKTEEELWLEATNGPTNGRMFGIGYVEKQRLWNGGPSNNQQLSLEVTIARDEVVRLKSLNEEKDAKIEAQLKQIETLTKEKDDLQAEVKGLNAKMESLLRIITGSFNDR